VAFRRLYYHEWLPNTWYAKVGGEFFWSYGLRFLAAFALEYAAWLWALLIAAGAVLGWRRSPSFLVLLGVFLVVPGGGPSDDPDIRGRQHRVRRVVKIG